MERLTCKTCGCQSMVPVQVKIDYDSEDLAQLLGIEPESRFYTCHVCGDNWLSVKEPEQDGGCTITFVHQMGTSPVLKRVVSVESDLAPVDRATGSWDYYLDDDEIDRDAWLDKLAERRKVLRSVCCN